jgi:hypothetical protein
MKVGKVLSGFAPIMYLLLLSVMMENFVVMVILIGYHIQQAQFLPVGECAAFLHLCRGDCKSRKWRSLPSSRVHLGSLQAG